MVSAFSANSVATNQSSRSHRVRADLMASSGDHRRMIRIDGNDDQLAMELDDVAVGQKMYIWGTRISVDIVQKQFNEFVRTFKASEVDEDETTAVGEDGKRTIMDLDEPYYLQRLTEINASEVPILNLNLGHVRLMKESLYKMIVCYPADVLPYLDIVVNEIFEEVYGKQLLTSIEVRPFNAETTKNLRDLNPEGKDSEKTRYYAVMENY